MKNKFAITQLLIFCISVYILLPKVAACTGVLNPGNAKRFSATDSTPLIADKGNSENLEDTYIPPNYGGPDSQHGSGTR